MGLVIHDPQPAGMGAALKREIAGVVQNAVGAPAEIVLARPHSMVMTSSGKLSRAKAKKLYLSGEIVPIQLAA